METEEPERCQPIRNAKAIKTSIDKNETELEKMKRESLEWLERYGKSAPPFISVAVNAFASQFRETPLDEIRQKLIAYDKFMSTHDFNGRLLSPEQAVDEFLKQK